MLLRVHILCNNLLFCYDMQGEGGRREGGRRRGREGGRDPREGEGGSEGGRRVRERIYVAYFGAFLALS